MAMLNNQRVLYIYGKFSVWHVSYDRPGVPEKNLTSLTLSGLRHLSFLCQMGDWKFKEKQQIWWLRNDYDNLPHQNLHLEDIYIYIPLYTLFHPSETPKIQETRLQ